MRALPARAGTVCAVAVVAVVAVVALLSAAGGAHVAMASSPTPSIVASAAVPGSAQTGAIPPAFVGLSFDMVKLPQIARDAGQGNLPSLLKSLGAGMLRFGGNSLDTQTAFVATGNAPSWAQAVITPADFRNLAVLAHETGWKVVLGVPLGHYDPAMAARMASSAKQILGSSLSALEIGNEPNRFALSTVALRPASWGLSNYLAEIAAYRRAVSAAVPGVLIEGPDVTQRATSWIVPAVTAGDTGPLSAHYYPFDACGSTRPTASDLVSATTVQTQESYLNSLRALAASTHEPMRVTETNDTACGGQPGVSNTFAAAIWATQLLSETATTGLSGDNFNETLSTSCTTYSPLCTAKATDITSGTYTSTPKWFALRLIANLVGTRPAGSSVVTGDASVGVTSFIASPSTTWVLITNTRARSAPADSLRLTTPWRVSAVKSVTVSASSLTSTTTPAVLGNASTPAAPWKLQALPAADIAVSAVTVPLSGPSIELLAVTRTGT